MNRETHELMLCAAYITKGFFETAERAKVDRAKVVADFSEIDLVCWITQFAEIIENVWKGGGTVASGVWVYDVPDPFGQWLAQEVNDKGELPYHDVALAKAVEMAKDGLAND